jgi:hypothetical protein
MPPPPPASSLGTASLMQIMAALPRSGGNIGYARRARITRVSLIQPGPERTLRSRRNCTSPRLWSLCKPSRADERLQRAASATWAGLMVERTSKRATAACMTWPGPLTSRPSNRNRRKQRETFRQGTETALSAGVAKARGRTRGAFQRDIELAGRHGFSRHDK